MPEQQKDMQSQKQKTPPTMPGDPAVKAGEKQNPKKAGAKDEDDDSDPSCGTGSCS